jgi:hypothetical protein
MDANIAVKLNKQPLLGSGFWALIVTFCVLIFLSGPAIFAYESYIWLRSGHRPSFNIYDLFAYAGFSVPTTNWLGVRKILEWFFAQELVWALPIISIPLGVVAVIFEEAAGTKETQAPKLGPTSEDPKEPLR